MMTDAEIISRIVWNRTIATSARVRVLETVTEEVPIYEHQAVLDEDGNEIDTVEVQTGTETRTTQNKVDVRKPKWTISGNLPPLKAGDLPIGESRTFRYECTQAMFDAVTRGIQKRIVASYRKHNEGDPVQQESPPDLAQQLIEAWSPA